MANNQYKPKEQKPYQIHGQAIAGRSGGKHAALATGGALSYLAGTRLTQFAQAAHHVAATSVPRVATTFPKTATTSSGMGGLLSKSYTGSDYSSRFYSDAVHSGKYGDWAQRYTKNTMQHAGPKAFTAKSSRGLRAAKSSISAGNVMRTAGGVAWAGIGMSSLGAAVVVESGIAAATKGYQRAKTNPSFHAASPGSHYLDKQGVGKSTYKAPKKPKKDVRFRSN
tara:strand:- start:12 stop:683 length:672 start_codon:yes stop_codon:yes gene_type:complete